MKTNLHKKSGWRRLCRVLTALLLCAVVPAPFSAAAAAADGTADAASVLPDAVYYVSPDGSDQNAGTKTAPFATLSKAYDALSATGGGTVVITGAIEPNNTKAWNSAIAAYHGAGTPVIHLTGEDPKTHAFYPDAWLRYDAVGLLGPTTLSALTLVPVRSSCYINTCGYRFTVEDGVKASGFAFCVHDGIGETQKGTVPSTETIINGGELDLIYLGGGYPTDPSQGVLGDVRFTVNGGVVHTAYIGYDRFLPIHTPGKIDGNLIITINGGMVDQISVNSFLADRKVGGFAALILNDGTASAYSTLPKGEKGSFIVTVSSEHARVSSEGEAGVFRLTVDPGYSAFLDGNPLAEGVIRLPEGTSAIRVRRTDAPPEITFDGAFAEGNPDGTFRPDSALSRAEAAALLLRITTDAESIAGKYAPSFSDVKKSDWYADAAGYFEYIGALPQAWLDASVFMPNAPVTRAEFIYLVDRLIEIAPAAQKLLTFSDVPQTSPYYSALRRAAGAGLVAGTDGGLFRPDDALSRAEAVTILDRLLKRVPSPAAKASFSDTAGHWADGWIAAAAASAADGVYSVDPAGERFVLSAPGSGGENYVRSLYASAETLSADAVRAGVDTVAEQMKKDILNTPNTLELYGSRITGNVYYISERHGSDSNSGTSPSSPWKTPAAISRLSSVPAGITPTRRSGAKQAARTSGS